MKYMKLGILPDTFYTEAAARTVLSEVPSDLTIQINNAKYRLHKFPLLRKCGLLQHLYCSDSDDSAEMSSPINLQDIPGGEEAFEFCAKFCYGISIKLSAHNFVPAIRAAKYLRMTESVSKGNLVTKLESFFDTCILQGWKDSIVALQATKRETIISCSENVGIVHRCADAIVGKILTHPSKVTWSYTYTRPGFDKKQHRSVPKDWWTEDISEVDLDLFRSIISAIRSTKQLPPALIGEALHVYACKHLTALTTLLLPTSENTDDQDTIAKQRRILESVVSMIPIEDGSVSCSFLLKLLKVANFVGESASSTRAELVRRSGRQLQEAAVKDLLFPSPSNPVSYDVDLVEAVLEVFLLESRQSMREEDANRMITSMRKVARTVDSYLQVIAQNANVTVSRFVELAQALPELARPEHNELYRAIDLYLKEHPDLIKAEKKQLCRTLDCRKLSSDVRSQAIRNDRLPLRTIVQALFIEQEKPAGTTNSSHETLHAHSFSNQHPELVETSSSQEKDNSAVHQRMVKSRSRPESKMAKKKNGNQCG